MLIKQKKNKEKYSNSKLHFIVFQTSKKPINLSISKKIVYSSLSILVLAILFISAFSYNSYISNKSLNDSISTLEIELQRLQNDNLKLGVENIDLKNSLDEKTAKVADALTEIENLQSSVKEIKEIVGIADEVINEDDEEKLNTEIETAQNLPKSSENNALIPPVSRGMMVLRNFDAQIVKQSANKTDENFENIETMIMETKQELEALFVNAEERKAYLDSAPTLFPTVGKITSEFGARWGTVHRGIDISNIMGTKIYAAGDGIVVESKLGYSYGNYILIEHENGFVTRYAHMSKRLINEGDVVKKGDLIGFMGNTGTSYGTHLHYEIYYYGKLIDPLKLEDYLEYK